MLLYEALKKLFEGFNLTKFNFLSVVNFNNLDVKVLWLVKVL